MMHIAIGTTHPKKLDDLKMRLTDAAFEVEFGISKAEVDEILSEDRLARETLYADYNVEILACTDLGPSIAEGLAAKAVRAFPGAEISINPVSNDVDGNAVVYGPNDIVVAQIQQFFEKERAKHG